jgi:hypothetical protein
VKFDTDGINLCSAITDQAIGVVVRGGTADAEVALAGEEVHAICGAAVTRGKHVIPHTDGTIKNTAASSQEFGLALETGVAGDWINILVLGSHKAQS